MKKKLIRISSLLLVTGSIIVVLANNKAKIDKAAQPVKETAIIPVKVHQVEVDSFSTSFSVNGVTSADREVKVASEVQGKLVNLLVDNGDVVKAGQLLAVLDASVYTAQLRSVETSLAKTELDVARFTRLIEIGGASNTQLEAVILEREALVAQKRDILERMSHMQIRAPFSRRIENVMVEKGSFVSYGTELADLVDISNIKIKVFLSEAEAFTIKSGQPVKISSVVFSAPVQGTINSISDKADASGKSLTEVKFNNTGKNQLKGGMITDVLFANDTKVKGASIPVSGLIGTAKQGRVFVVINDHVELRNVRTGVSTNDKVQVVEGLHPGEQVVVSGQLNLENGSRITINK